MRVIRLTESDLKKIVKRVLTEQKAVGVLKFGDRSEAVRELQQRLMKLGYLKLKSGQPTTYFGPLTRDAIKRFQSAEKLTPTGEYDQSTRNILMLKSPILVGDIKPGKTGSQSVPSPNIKPGAPVQPAPAATTDTGDCVGLDRNQCRMISSSKAVAIPGEGGEECAAYVTKCLSQYDKEFRAGDAWKARSIRTNALNKGTERFNMFSPDKMDWKKIFNELRAQKINKKYCEQYKTARSDPYFGKGKIQKIGMENIPQKVDVNVSSLKPGDVVGLWHNATKTIGKAMCDRLVDDLKLDDAGNFQEKPFTYNTHVGFVTAIKDGVPIIVHNVSGKIEALPATKALTKDSPDMITWVVSDPDVEREVAKRMKNTQTPDAGSFFKRFTSPEGSLSSQNVNTKR